MNAYDHNQRSSVIAGLELDPVVPKLVRYIHDQANGEEEIVITATELMEAITPREFKNRPSNWPKNANAFAAHLGRISSALREIGIELTKEQTNSKRMIVLRKNYERYDPNIILGADASKPIWEEEF